MSMHVQFKVICITKAQSMHVAWSETANLGIINVVGGILKLFLFSTWSTIASDTGSGILEEMKQLKTRGNIV